MSGSFALEAGHASQAVDINTLAGRLLGRGVVEGGEPVEGARPFAVDILDATVYIGGDAIQMPATSIDCSEYARPDQPRKLLLYLAPSDDEERESGGDYQIAAGQPADPKPQGAIRFDTYEPSPPDLHASEITAAPVAELWIGATAQQITDDDIRDRRLTADLSAHAIRGETGAFDALVDGDETRHTAELADIDDAWTDTAIREAITTDPDHATNAYHDYFSGAHDDLSNVTDGAHHDRYDDPEAQDAVRGAVDAADLTATSAGVPGQHLGIAGDGNDTTWVAPPQAEAPVLASGSVTHTGGGSTTVLLAGITPAQTTQFEIAVGVGVNSEPTWDGDYGYSADVSKQWDSADGEADVELTLQWDIDPDSGSDLELSYTAYDLAPETVTELYDDDNVVRAVSGESIDPAAVLAGARLHPPVYDATSTASSPAAGDVIMTTGDGSEGFGEWVYDGSGWQGPYAEDLTALSELTIDTAKDWGGFRIPNVGTPESASDLIRQQDITDHAAADDAHHAPTTGSDIDHTDIANVQPDQHHSPPSDGDVAEGVAGRSFSVPITASEIPDGQAVRAHAVVGAGERLELVRGEYYTESGNTPSGLSVQLARLNGSVLYEQSDKLATGSSSDPLAKITGAEDLDIRIHNGSGSTVVAGGGVAYQLVPADYIRGSTVDMPSDTDTQTVNVKQGVEIEPTVDITGLQAQLSERIQNATTAYIQDVSGAVLGQEDISSLESGDTIDIVASTTLNSDETYHVLADADGAEYTRGRYNASNQFPYSSSDFDVTNGIYTGNGSTTANNRYNFTELTALKDI